MTHKTLRRDPWHYDLEGLSSEEFRKTLSPLQKSRIERDLADLTRWTIIAKDGDPFTFCGTLEALKNSANEFYPEISDEDAWRSAVASLVRSDFVILRRNGVATGPGGLSGFPFHPDDIRSAIHANGVSNSMPLPESE